MIAAYGVLLKKGVRKLPANTKLPKFNLKLVVPRSDPTYPNATMQWDSNTDKSTVLKGSGITTPTEEFNKKSTLVTKRKKMEDDGVIELTKKGGRFLKDHEFKTARSAAKLIQGLQTANANVQWEHVDTKQSPHEWVGENTTDKEKVTKLLDKLGIDEKERLRILKGVDDSDGADDSGDEDLEALTVAKLKERCKEAGLPVTGKKAELIERLDDSGDEDLEALTVVKLKERCKEAGLPVSGKKAELIDRLNEHGSSSEKNN